MGFTQELKHLIIGLDVGQKVDRSVLVLLEKIQEYGHDPFEGKNAVGRPYYNMPYMDRFPLDVPTPQQVDRVKRTYNQIRKKYELKPTLIIDLGNVGRAHFDEYLQSGFNVYGINFLGDGVQSDRTPDRNIYGVSKKDLASALSILLENDRLRIAEDITDRKIIINELSKFTWKQTAAGNITVENLKASDHDDIVSALMIAAWYAEYGIREITFSSKKGTGLP